MPRAIFLLAGCIALLTGCGQRSAEVQPERVVTVRVTVPEAPPPESEISIRIVEVSGPDRAIVGTLTVPYAAGPFAVKVPSGRIRDTQQYGLEINVVHIGAAIFRNKEPYYVLTRGNGDQVTATLSKL